MATGFYINTDRLPIQLGTRKATPELAGDFVAYGPNRIMESYINLGATSFGVSAPQNPALPSSFSGTTTPEAAGIVSMTKLFPLQATAPVTVASSSGVLTISKPQLFIERIDLECLVSANAGTGGATGLTGIGLVTINDASPPVFVQVTPNAGVQLVGAVTNAQMTAGKHFTWYSDGSSFGTGTPPTAGSWLGNVPLVTNSISPLPTNGYISAIASGGTFTGASGGGLLKLRVYYHMYGTINQ